MVFIVAVKEKDRKKARRREREGGRKGGRDISGTKLKQMYRPKKKLKRERRKYEKCWIEGERERVRNLETFFRKAHITTFRINFLVREIEI
jgi:hypothetical protein